MPDLHVPCADYGIWTDHRIPDDRSGWHPAVQAFYEYWLAVTPPDRLPGRQHIKPEDIAPLLSRVWLADVHRDPLRLRFRLAGTAAVWSFGHEVTGQWLDEVQPVWLSNATVYERFRFTVETGRPTWRRGFSLWDRDPEHRRVENCHVPLAKDGKYVDMIFSLAVIFDHKGNEIRI
jgi:hypothetical protein